MRFRAKKAASERSLHWLPFFCLFLPAFALAEKCPEGFRVLAQPPLVLQQTDYTCGAACVVSLVKQLKGKTIPESEIARILGTSESLGTMPSQLAAGMQRLGLNARVQEPMSLARLRQGLARGKSFVLLVQSGDDAHWVALAGFEKGRIQVMDPWKENTGYLEYSPEEFLSLWETGINGQRFRRLGIVVD